MIEKYIFDMKIMGTPRPRFSLHNGRVIVYTPSDYSRYLDAIATEYTRQGGGLHYGPVEVTIDTYRLLPKSRPKSVTSEPDIYTPDPDNIIKAFLDALTGFAYQDDRLVVSSSIHKNPRTRPVGRKTDRAILDIREL